MSLLTQYIETFLYSRHLIEIQNMIVSVLTISMVVSAAAAQESKLLVDGFAWAEQLAFDGIGGLFVSEAVRGELWRVSACGKYFLLLFFNHIFSVHHLLILYR